MSDQRTIQQCVRERLLYAQMKWNRCVWQSMRTFVIRNGKLVRGSGMSARMALCLPRNFVRVATCDYAASEMHRQAMVLHVYCKENVGGDPLQYELIVQVLSKLNDLTARRVVKKFKITYVLCWEGMAFAKMETLCHLEEWHGVDWGTGYRNQKAAVTFCDYIGQTLKEQLKSNLDSAKFFRVQTHRSNDAPNIEKYHCLVRHLDYAGQLGDFFTKQPLCFRKWGGVVVQTGRLIFKMYYTKFVSGVMSDRVRPFTDLSGHYVRATLNSYRMPWPFWNTRPCMALYSRKYGNSMLQRRQWEKMRTAWLSTDGHQLISPVSFQEMITKLTVLWTQSL